MPEGMRITNIRRGKGIREAIIYAHLEDKDGNLIISATLEYIVAALNDKNRIWHDVRKTA
jgi:hypothetical protein